MEMAVVILVALVAFGAVVWPLFRTRDEAWDPHLEDDPGPATGEAALDRTLRAEIDSYREALRAGAVCARCATANANGSRFCAACGFRLETDEGVLDEA